MSDVRFPDITVRLVGETGNPAHAIGATLRALQRSGVSEAIRKEFTAEATSGDYDHVLDTVERWVTVE